MRSFDSVLKYIQENYQRVIPRDFFNESMLLKCMGKLTLLIHNNQLPPELVIDYDDSGFEVDLTEHGLEVSNATLSYGGVPLTFFTPYNSREPWPMFVVNEENYEEVQVFDNKGNVLQEFLDFLAGTSAEQ